jgi:hypothetical protein
VTASTSKNSPTRANARSQPPPWRGASRRRPACARACRARTGGRCGISGPSRSGSQRREGGTGTGDELGAAELERLCAGAGQVRDPPREEWARRGATAPRVERSPRRVRAGSPEKQDDRRFSADAPRGTTAYRLRRTCSRCPARTAAGGRPCSPRACASPARCADAKSRTGTRGGWQ